MFEIRSLFEHYFEMQSRRILTQLDRDPDSPTFGCFDRNYWHYKIRDFPSSILQQGVFAVEALRKYDSLGHIITKRKAYQWSLAAINALSRQVSNTGTVEEYFPFEDSYPAAAFGLYSATRILVNWQIENVELLKDVDWKGLRRLAARLAKRSELQAANQYATGLAGLALATKLKKMKLNSNCITKHVDQLLKLQHSEGWFYEYGGPDFGYLSVTIDALTDYYDATKDKRAIEAIDKAIEFLAKLVGDDGDLPWTLNSRNTDYVVPYGLVRAASRNSTSSWLVKTLYANLSDTKHWIWSTDDRYHLHYIFSSFARSLPYIELMIQPSTPQTLPRSWLSGCGFWVVRNQQAGATIYVGARKGGILRIHEKDSTPAKVDHGWRIQQSAITWTSNFWQNNLTITLDQNQISITGNMVHSKYYKSGLIRHLLLRIAAFFLGQYLTLLLKKVMIFKKGSNIGPRFKRLVQLNKEGVRLEDELISTFDAVSEPGPRQNLRHVASANSFHPEEVISPILGDVSLKLPKGKAVIASTMIYFSQHSIKQYETRTAK